MIQSIFTASTSGTKSKNLTINDTKFGGGVGGGSSSSGKTKSSYNIVKSSSKSESNRKSNTRFDYLYKESDNADQTSSANKTSNDVPNDGKFLN